MSGTNEELTCQERNQNVVLLPNPGVSESQANGADLKNDGEFCPTMHYHGVHIHTIYLGGVHAYVCVCVSLYVRMLTRVCMHVHTIPGTPATDL